MNIAPWNNLFLILIVVWLRSGYSMVLFSAALKGIPEEILEAARVDGANEVQIFSRIMVPYILGTIITVWTTVVIFTLKIFVRAVDKALTEDIFGRAIDVQGELAKSGRHRFPIPDLLVAAAAEKGGLTVLHYDGDYDIIASVTGQPAE